MEEKGSAFVRVPLCLVCWLHTVPVTCRWCHPSLLLSALCRVVEASTLQQERLQAIAVSPCSGQRPHVPKPSPAARGADTSGEEGAGAGELAQLLSPRPGVPSS